jgi:peroxiredoxin
MDMRAVANIVAGGLAAALAAFAAPGPVAASELGPALGGRAPALTVRDSGGAATSLKGIAGPKGVVLVFTRSAKWCPYCQAQLIALKDAVEPLAKRGFRVAALSYDSPAILARFAKARAIPYALLSDEGSVTIDAFGLRDPDYRPGHYASGVPRPAIFVLAPNGTVLAKLAEESYQNRPTLEAVLDSVDRLGS